MYEFSQAKTRKLAHIGAKQDFASAFWMLDELAGLDIHGSELAIATVEVKDPTVLA